MGDVHGVSVRHRDVSAAVATPEGEGVAGLPIVRDAVFFEPSMGCAFRLWESRPAFDDEPLRARPVALIPFASVGVSIPFRRRPDEEPGRQTRRAGRR